MSVRLPKTDISQELADIITLGEVRYFKSFFLFGVCPTWYMSIIFSVSVIKGLFLKWLNLTRMFFGVFGGEFLCKAGVNTLSSCSS